ncbi:hypothetical protein ILUMI_00454 [Ignelater luminosus]|uniref:Uncharacterized protein n=1 Tax=Ignelater luminosus TaxID=2038154 RepID=A0A8K0DLU7_IGNLU|nr:hypothetical protein ILUMI_00454 [Ignelater luminosus]
MTNRKGNNRHKNRLLDPNTLDENTKKTITEKLEKATESINYDLPVEELWQKCKETFTEYKKDTKELYKKIRQLTGNKRNNKDLPLHNKNGRNIYTVKEQTERWQEYFQEILNGNNEGTQNPQEIDSAELPTSTDTPTRKEISQALKGMKNGKAPRNDMITVDILKMDIATTVNIIKPLIDKIRINETFPEDWKEAKEELSKKIHPNGKKHMQIRIRQLDQTLTRMKENSSNSSKQEDR